ncbi:PREDICTED: protein-methionine sulfoxide oxidase MICAL2-like, partial [Amphimedon queenslandica]
MATSAPVTAGDRDSSEGYRSLVDPAEIFTYFTEKAWDVPQIIGSFSLLKDKLGIDKEAYGVSLYHSLKSKLTHWKAKTLWELLDKKVQLNEYKNQKACQGTSVCVVGCGPVGMRFAIEAALLGCDIVVVEKRPYFSRNNVLHLWPFTIDDLKRLGAKKFYGQFCAGSLDHISIRSLQSILLKTSLMFGVRIYFGIEFVKIKEPGGGRAWHADFLPSNHPLNDIDFSVLVGA